MKMDLKHKHLEAIKEKVKRLNQNYINSGFTAQELEISYFKSNSKHVISQKMYILAVIIIILSLIFQFDLINNIVNYCLGVRCLLRNNYFVWESTRPVSDCKFCSVIKQPVIIQNVTREDFAPYAFSSQPILIKKVFSDWPAIKKFNLEYFKDLYYSIDDSYKSVDEECQFLHFKSDFISLQDVFNMTELRMRNKEGEKSWYVGWGNCHPQILKEMRKYYPKPHFLPEDCEIPSKEYVFMGYDDGATMHLDFINRLMWQAQLRGTKEWNLLPPPECESVCSPLTFTAEPGDAVLVDTRIWYHGTKIVSGEFSLSVQSEYG